MKILNISKLPKELITVTPLSRMVAIVVLIMVMIDGFALGILYQESINIQKDQRAKSQALLETSASQPTASPTIDTSNWKTYPATTFPISFQYPDTWSIQLLRNKLDIPTVGLRKISTAKDQYPTEILIGDFAVYSTSGTLCSNQRCNSNYGKIDMNIGNEKISTNIVEAFDEKNNKINYYASQITLPKYFAVKIPLLYSEPVAPTLTIRYKTDEEKQEILTILSTFRFTE